MEQLTIDDTDEEAGERTLGAPPNLARAANARGSTTAMTNDRPAMYKRRCLPQLTTAPEYVPGSLSRRALAHSWNGFEVLPVPMHTKLPCIE